MRTLLFVFVFAALSVWVACGGSTSDSKGSGCPSTHPSDNAACSGVTECEYASSIAEFCGNIVTCTQGSFLHADGTCSPPGGGGGGDGGVACPATKAQVKIGEACTEEKTCDYPDGRCGCVVPSGPVQIDGGGRSWQCTKAPAGCPEKHPLLGTSCSMEGQTCDYGGCLFHDGNTYSSALVEKCSGGIWVRGMAACPQ